MWGKRGSSDEAHWPVCEHANFFANFTTICAPYDRTNGATYDRTHGATYGFPDNTIAITCTLKCAFFPNAHGERRDPSS